MIRKQLFIHIIIWMNIIPKYKFLVLQQLNKQLIFLYICLSQVFNICILPFSDLQISQFRPVNCSATNLLLEYSFNLSAWISCEIWRLALTWQGHPQYIRPLRETLLKFEGKGGCKTLSIPFLVVRWELPLPGYWDLGATCGEELLFWQH